MGQKRTEAECARCCHSPKWDRPSTEGLREPKPRVLLWTRRIRDVYLRSDKQAAGQRGVWSSEKVPSISILKAVQLLKVAKKRKRRRGGPGMVHSKKEVTCVIVLDVQQLWLLISISPPFCGLPRPPRRHWPRGAPCPHSTGHRLHDNAVLRSPVCSWLRAGGF